MSGWLADLAEGPPAAGQSEAAAASFAYLHSLLTTASGVTRPPASIVPLLLSVTAADTWAVVADVAATSIDADGVTAVARARTRASYCPLTSSDRTRARATASPLASGPPPDGVAAAGPQPQCIPKAAQGHEKAGPLSPASTQPRGAARKGCRPSVESAPSI